MADNNNTKAGKLITSAWKALKLDGIAALDMGKEGLGFEMLHLQTQDYVNAAQKIFEALALQPPGDWINRDCYQSLATIYAVNGMIPEAKEAVDNARKWVKGDFNVETLAKQLKILEKGTYGGLLNNKWTVKRNDILAPLRAAAEQKAAEQAEADKYMQFIKDGSAANKAKNYAEAIRCYRQALDMKKSQDGYWSLGYEYYLNGEPEKAIETYTAGIQLGGDKTYQLYYNRGCTYAEMKDYKNAVADLNKGIELGYDKAKGQAKLDEFAAAIEANKPPVEGQVIE
jgi:tetratricopeptide (TPR) repeat protein